MRALAGWAAAAHPLPLAMVLALTACVAFASADGRPDACRLALLLFAMLCSQLAIGWSNDYLDRDVDALYQPSKPVPAGLVDARAMPRAVGAALVLSLVAGVALGPVPLALLVTGTGAGLAYNLWLKASRFSVAAYIVAFAVLPPFVWAALDAYRDDFLFLYPITLSLPVAAHVANVLPDREGDRAQGRRTVAVRLGETGSRAAIGACLAAPPLLLALSLAWLDYDAATLLGMLAAYGGLCAGAAVALLRGGRGGRVWAFRAVAAAGVVFAAGWLAAV